MKIEHTASITDYINELDNLNNMNMYLSDIFLDITGNFDEKITNRISQSKNIEKEYKKVVSEYLDVDESDVEEKTMFDNYIASSIHLIGDSKYIDNDYIKNINIKPIKQGKYELVIDKYKPFELFSFSDIKVDSHFNEKTTMAFFEKEYKFPAILKDKITWMNITPNEINTMEKAINTVSGNVLVYGLGLGYFPYMISNKNNVNKITIIEYDQEIISLFKKFIFPQFPNKNKIEIILCDAFKYQANNKGFDYVFVDLWHSAEDGIMCYKHFKKQELSSNCKFIYWLEDSFKALLRRAFITLLVEQYNSIKIDYSKSENVFDSIVNIFNEKTQSLKLSSIENIHNAILDSSLINLFIS